MVRRLFFALVAGLALAGSNAAGKAGALCTLVVDSKSGAVLTENGDCETRVTPASTFKIALAAIGFEEGLLQGPHEPVRQYRKGEVDWGGRAWRGHVDPTSWMKHSVVWYSQRLTRKLGADKLEAWTRALGYGNADFSGDPGKGNGLERAWIASSLAISPRVQARFLRGLLNRTLPLSQSAMAQTEALVERFSIDGGWTLSGKTGGAYPRRADGSFDRARGYGWFVGWATRGDTRAVFVRLTQDEVRHSVSPGLRARSALLAEWPALAARFAR
ncbi:class D beta-lactamase [Stappia sp.]|uniref:class D beta-lactamase n=1 Tax=Stappia sp. TaxID=1870903 RepID=UPI003C7A3070